MERVENPEVWYGRLTDPLPGRTPRRSATVDQQEAEDFARLRAFGQGG